jgi:nicotinamidase-related amidase
LSGYGEGMSSDPYADWALVVVDVQQGFDDPFWGVRNNPDGDRNIAALVDDWASHGRPLVFVQHDAVEDESPLDPGTPGNQLKPYLKADPDLAVSKAVNSAFHGTPDLHAWLVDRKTAGIVVCGITTNHCCDTTARVGGNLGHDVLFALDATYTFDRTGPDGHTLTADELARATATTCTVSSRPSPARRSCWQGRPDRSTSGGSSQLLRSDRQRDVRRRRFE